MERLKRISIFTRVVEYSFFTAAAPPPKKTCDMTHFSWLKYRVQPDRNFKLIITQLSPQDRFVINDSQSMIHWFKAGTGI
jgi:hypothetical protein